MYIKISIVEHRFRTYHHKWNVLYVVALIQVVLGKLLEPNLPHYHLLFVRTTNLKFTKIKIILPEIVEIFLTIQLHTVSLIGTEI